MFVIQEQKINLKKKTYIICLKNVIITNPLNYTDFSKLLINSKIIVTDSRVHEEAYFHKKKCFLRNQIEGKFLNEIFIKRINFNNRDKFKKILKVKVDLKLTKNRMVVSHKEL